MDTDIHGLQPAKRPESESSQDSLGLLGSGKSGLWAWFVNDNVETARAGTGACPYNDFPALGLGL